MDFFHPMRPVAVTCTRMRRFGLVLPQQDKNFDRYNKIQRRAASTQLNTFTFFCGSCIFFRQQHNSMAAVVLVPVVTAGLSALVGFAIGYAVAPPSARVQDGYGSASSLTSLSAEEAPVEIVSCPPPSYYLLEDATRRLPLFERIKQGCRLRRTETQVKTASLELTPQEQIAKQICAKQYRLRAVPSPSINCERASSSSSSNVFLQQAKAALRRSETHAPVVCV